MDISTDFDSGNILVDSMNGTTATLRLRNDSNGPWFQWFHFRVDSRPNEPHKFTIVNAWLASYPKAWPGYRALASYDGNSWWRVPTTYDGTHLTIEFTPAQAITTYAFFVPYSEARRMAFLQECKVSGGAERETLGISNDGRPIEMLTMGSRSADAKVIWIVSRQHAGEPMAEWCTEGLIRRLLDTSDSKAHTLLQRTRFHIVPNMNPDGSMRGNLRANAAGVDLNRAWANPPANAPEVRVVLDAIARMGIDLFLDIHGDEERPYLWIVDAEGDLTDEQKRMQQQFETDLKQLNPEVQPRPRSVVGVNPQGEPGMAVNYLMATYGVPGWIIELPFSPTADYGNGEDSLLVSGCIRVGHSLVEVLSGLIDQEVKS